MQTVKLDGSRWTSERDFYDALASALGSVNWHGRNADAFLETMVYHLDLNSIQPPYVVVVENVSETIRPLVHGFASWLAEARQHRVDDLEWGDDVEVSVRTE